MFESVTEGLFAIDSETCEVLLCNQIAAGTCGFDSPEKVLGLNLLDLVYPNDKERAQKALIEAMFERDLHNFVEFRMVTQDGEARWVSIIGTAIEYRDKLLGLVSFRDITGYKQMEEARHRSERKFYNLISENPDSIVVVDQDGFIRFVNRAAETLFGKESGELTGEQFGFPMTCGEATELNIVRSDGVGITAEMHVVEGEWEGEDVYFASLRDITERKMAEEQIARYTERLEVTTELMRIISSSSDIRDVFKTFAAVVKRLVDFDQVTITLVEGNDLKFLAVSSSEDMEFIADSTVPLRGTVTAWVVDNKQTNVEADFEKRMQFPFDEDLFSGGIRSAIRVPMFAQGEVFGTFNLNSRRPNAFGQREQEILEDITNQIAVAIDNKKLFAEVKRQREDLEVAYKQLSEQADALVKSRQELDEAYLNMARVMILNQETSETYAVGHSERVVQLCRQVAIEMGISVEDVKKLEMAAEFHDLGRIGIPMEILSKPRALTPEEMEEIRRHQAKTAELLRPSPLIQGALPIIESHHERYNGGGYPNGLKGEEIPLGSRILAVAEAYDALISQRFYRPAMSSAAALNTIQQESGTKWDPKVVETFCRYMSQTTRV